MLHRQTWDEVAGLALAFIEEHYGGDEAALGEEIRQRILDAPKLGALPPVVDRDGLMSFLDSLTEADQYRVIKELGRHVLFDPFFDKLSLTEDAERAMLDRFNVLTPPRPT